MAYPLITVGGRYREINSDLELPATRVVQLPDGAATLSDANKGKIRYNNVSKTFQLSVDGGAFGDIVTGTNYAYLPGRAGGQTLIGGTDATDDMILRATAGVGASGSDIIFQVGNNGGTEAMRILYDGKVGIGIAAPSYALHVASSGSPGKISKTTPNNNVYEVLQLEANYAAHYLGVGLGPQISFNIAGYTAATRTIASIYANMNWGPTHGDLVFCTADGGAPVEHLRICRQGYVGVNTGAIDTLYNGIFTVRSVASNHLMLKEVSWDAVGPQIIFEKRRSDYDRVYDGDVIGRIDFQAYRGGDHSHAAEISVFVDGAYNWNKDEMPGAIYFKTSPSGSGTPLSRMVIKNSGYVGIGTITPSSILEVSSNGALTNTTIPLQTYSHTTSGVAAAGFGIKNLYRLEDAGGTTWEAAAESVSWLVPTAGTPMAEYQLALRTIGSASLLPFMRLSQYNIAVGMYALNAAGVVGLGNVAFGNQALRYNIGYANVGVGDQALRDNTSGTDNVAVGSLALAMSDSGTFNCALGASALTTIVDGHFNCAFGAFALTAQTTGTYNCAFGDHALSGVTTGEYNIGIGSNLGASIGSGASNILIGYSIDTAVDESSTVKIGLGPYLTLDGFCFAGLGATTLRGFQPNSLAGVSDIILTSYETRTAGDLLRVDNVAATKFSVSFNGSITSTGAQTVSVKKIDETASPYTISADGYIISVTSNANNIDIYLPSAVANAMRVIKIKHTDSFAGTGSVITITSPVAGNIDGAASYVIDTDYEYVTVYSDGTNWFIIG